MEILINHGDRGEVLDLWPVSLVVGLIVLALIWYRTRNLSYMMCCAIFGFYLINVASLTLFPMHMDVRFADSWDVDLFLSNINLIPFNFGKTVELYPDLLRLAVQALLLNILLTVPFGFGLSFIRSIKRRQIWLIGLGVGLAIESVQLMLCLILRINYRQIDINDVLMNALGVWVGYGLFMGFARFYSWLIHKQAFRPRGALAYIQTVCESA